MLSIGRFRWSEVFSGNKINNPTDAAYFYQYEERKHDCKVQYTLTGQNEKL